MSVGHNINVVPGYIVKDNHMFISGTMSKENFML